MILLILLGIILFNITFVAMAFYFGKKIRMEDLERRLKNGDYGFH